MQIIISDLTDTVTGVTLIYLVWITVTPHLSCCHHEASLSPAVVQTQPQLFSSSWLTECREDKKNKILCPMDEVQQHTEDTGENQEL